MKDLSVIVPTYSVREPLVRCLRSLLDQSYPSDRYEILVINNGGKEHSESFLRPLIRDLGAGRLQLVEAGTNLGYSGGCRLGAERAEGRLLVFFNDDAVADPGWLALAWAEWEQFPDLGVVTCRIVDAEGPRLQHEGAVQTSPNGLFWQPGYGTPDFFRSVTNGETGRDLEFFSGCVWGTPKAVWEQIGGLNPVYHPGYYEDTEYGLRCRQLGYRIRLLTTVTCAHHGSLTLGHASPRYWVAFHRSRYLFLFSNYLEDGWGEIIRAELEWWRNHRAGENRLLCFQGFASALSVVPSALASRFRFRRKLLETSAGS